VCSRLLFLSVVVLGSVLSNRVSAQSSQSAERQRLSVGVVASRVDFASEIRFEDANALGLSAMVELRPWWRLGLQFDRVSARDRDLDRWQSILVASIQSRFLARPEAKWSPLLGAGVSFMGFEDSESFDAVAEGLDLTLGAQLRLDPRWTLRGEFLSRMQSFNVVIVDARGRPTGEGEETGYRWSRVMQVGLDYAF
jgi:Outer membrane protein beta-barrel domain